MAETRGWSVPLLRSNSHINSINLRQNVLRYFLPGFRSGEFSYQYISMRHSLVRFQIPHSIRPAVQTSVWQFPRVHSFSTSKQHFKARKGVLRDESAKTGWTNQSRKQCPIFTPSVSNLGLPLQIQRIASLIISSSPSGTKPAQKSLHACSELAQLTPFQRKKPML